MVVVAAGDVVTMISFARSRTSWAASAPTLAMRPRHSTRNYVGGDFREDRDLMDAQIILGFEGRAYHVRDFYASQVLSMILGGGMSSRLFQEVREKRGLCYSIYSFHWGFSDTGIFGVHAATGEGDIAKLVPLILDELQKAGESISQAELDRARAQYRAGLIMSAESAASRASQIARQILLFGRPIDKEELMTRLSALTVERLTDLSARLFSTRPTSPPSGRSVRCRTTRRSPTCCLGRHCPRAKLRSERGLRGMFALPFFRRDLPALNGERVTLRTPTQAITAMGGPPPRKPRFSRTVGAALDGRRA